VLGAEWMAVGVRENARSWRRARAMRVASDGRAGETGVAALAAAERADVVFA